MPAAGYCPCVIPWALERLSVTDEGKLRYALKHPYSDGTTHFLFEPLDLLAKLAALVPRPRVNLTRYHGVFAPNSKLRPRLVPGKPHKKHGHKPDASNQPTPSQPVLSDPTPMTRSEPPHSGQTVTQRYPGRHGSGVAGCNPGVNTRLRKFQGGR